MATQQELEAWRDRLDKAIGRGVLRVRDSDGKDVTYRSITELREARKHVEDLIRKLTPGSKRRAMALSTTVSRGL